MSLLLSLLFSFVLAVNFSPPRLQESALLDHPLNTTGSSWVILDVETDAQGNARSVETLLGADPFHTIALSNVRQWVSIPAGNPLPRDSRVTIIFLFRPRDLFSAWPMQLVSFKRHADRPAFPLELSDPGYPHNSVGEGAVVLELQIARTGLIQGVRVVSDTPGLAAHTERAVRSWRFEPAMRSGSATAGTVIVVASYLRPALYNTPATGSPYVPYNPAAPVVVPPPAAVFRDKPPAGAHPPF